MLLPERPVSTLFVNKVPVPSANPMRLWRKNNQAAILEFSVPRKTYLSLVDIEGLFRQGDIIQSYYGLGTSQQRIFYGYLPAEGADKSLDETHAVISLTATDFIGQLQSRFVTLGDSSSSYLNPVGAEIGGFVTGLVNDTINAQYATPAFSIMGVKGTSPAQFITEENASYGTKTAKAWIDLYTALAYDDTYYPNPPLAYEYHQRDQYFIWRKQKSTASNTSVLTLTIGKDAIVSGQVQRQPIYTDALATGRTSDAQWSYADRDSSRRWGGRRFTANVSTTSSYQEKAYADAVRTVETKKNERTSFILTTMRDPFLLYPGDLLRVYGGAPFGILSTPYRIAEVNITMSPTLSTKITVGDPAAVLTNYL